MRIVSNGKTFETKINGFRGPSGPDGSPIGTIISFMGKNAPKDYLICDGGVYNISDYPHLASFIQKQFQTINYFGGDGTTTFAVPDMRNLFLSGWSADTTRPVNVAVLYCIKAVESIGYENMYSIEERIIGRWIDGKPLYRKVVFGTWPTNGAGETPIMDDGTKIAVKLYNIYALINNTSSIIQTPINDDIVGENFVRAYCGDDGKLHSFCRIASYNGKVFYAIIDYTKDSDKAHIDQNSILALLSLRVATQTAKYDFYQDYDEEVI